MGALAPSPHWTPEDDLLLKYAIEAGASLESLAKGAVQFSRRFTNSEVQERWYSLLYDPVISTAACDRMYELERSTPNLPPKFNFHRTGNSKETKSLPAKRKAQTIRACFHEHRKKMCFNPFPDMDDLDYLVPPSDANCLGDVAEHFSGNKLLEDPLLTNFEFGPHHLDIMHSFPEIGPGIPLVDGSDLGHSQAEDNFCSEIMTAEVPQNDNAFTENGFGVSEQNILSSSSEMVYRSSDLEDNYVFNSQFQDCGPSHTLQTMECSSQIPITTERLSEVVSVSALHEKAHRDSNISDTSRCGPKKQLPLPSESVAPMACTGTDLAEISNCLLNGEDFLDLGGKDLAEKSYFDGFRSLLENATDKTAKTSAAPDNVDDVSETPDYDPHPEIVNGVINCVLNTEDPEIPCNDHVIFPLSPGRTLQSSSWAQTNIKPCRTANGNARTSRLSRETIRSEGDTKTPQIGLRCGQNLASIPKDMNPEIEKAANGAATNPTHWQNGNHDDTVKQENFEAEVDILTAMVESEEDPVDSDDELPYFSDVEAMILEMDLDPDDQDLFELEVAKYQHEDVKRAIIRLEQSARSCMERQIASQGAIAIIYGRDFKCFIKKQEVLLGRSTEEYQIDIDLGRGGSKTHISRRQAIISLDNNGSFHIRNLGKRPIDVNDKELDPGESSNLLSNSLIEIRGMAFMFESSEKCIKRFLDGIRNEQYCQKPSSASIKVS